MKVISYNVNGIRAAERKGLSQWLQASGADVVCLQEIKALENQIETSLYRDIGFEHQYYFPAEKKGYSGVAVLSKQLPKKVEFGTGISFMDVEGRNLRVDFEDFSLMSLYLPSGTNDARLSLKFEYMEAFLAYTENLLKTHPKLIVSGDYNICHKAIDIHDPVRLKTVSGFLPEERAWLSAFVQAGFVDSFRQFNENPHQYSWWSYRAGARQNNKGWRIDYHMVSEALKPKLKAAQIHPEAHHSDHCPVSIDLSV
ncbi:MAG: exodeoxyribonuclease III [Flavobacteriaceae bacterium]|nr:exodeoxyribonuclease III [Flavobacteriaceae bacterium]